MLPMYGETAVGRPARGKKKLQRELFKLWYLARNLTTMDKCATKVENEEG